MTHPFHPWFGREFVFAELRQTWGEDRVLFLDEDGQLLSLPAGWTDAVPVDLFVSIAAGRCPFRTADLLALAQMVAALRDGSSARPCKADSAGDVREILPSGRTLMRGARS
jgi:hypothetical protein